MSHLDEGTLHALLDGELEMSEMAEIQAHLGSCAACGSRLREVKQVLMEADRLVAEVQVEARGRTPIEVPRREPELDASPFRAPPDPWESAPVLLIPDNPDPGEIGRRWLKRLAWAASLLVIVGAGYLGIQMRRGGTAPFLTDAAPVTSRPEAAPAPAPASSTLAAAGADSVRGGAAAGKSAKPANPPPARTGALQKTAQVPQSAARPRKDGTRKEEPADTRTDKLAQASGDSETKQVAPAEDESRGSVVREAAQAMEELDRERTRQRAAAATAALDSAARRRAQARSPAPGTPSAGNASTVASNEPPVTLIPAIRTPEQRAQIYLRIGLDEASRQLGSPVHVIEGMSPMFMGLAQGRLSPGADTTRPVVRVVYQDSQGRLIFLDQQQVRSGQSPGPAPSGEPAWVLGETRLHLHGEVGPDVLSRIRPRVR
jgi:hypothetical protein